MKDLRPVKRRRISNDLAEVNRGDETISNVERGIHSCSTPTRLTQENLRTSLRSRTSENKKGGKSEIEKKSTDGSLERNKQTAVSRRISLRSSARRRQSLHPDIENEDTDIGDFKAKFPRSRSAKFAGELSENESPEAISNHIEDSPTPTRVGLRSSARLRQKFLEDEIAVVLPAKTAKENLSNEGLPGGHSRKVGQSGETDEDGENIHATRTGPEKKGRPRMTPVKSKTAASGNDRISIGHVEYEKQSPFCEDIQDGFDDLTSLQIQQIFLQNATNASDDSAAMMDILPEYAERFQSLCHGSLCRELVILTRVVQEKLTGKRRIPLKGLEKEYEKIHQLIEQTVTAGEGNSLLVLGSRGSGKTSMVETIISSLARSHGDDFHVVRLNGFLHIDDRIALREMWRQLGRETSTEDEAAKVSSNADVMAMLLALFSHPEEIFGASNNTETITAKSVVIILDEFDLFASHPRQTLLYNLFDIAQARKAPIAVIGLSTKVDVTEMLEKRVKSRFSHRHVFLPLSRTFEVFCDICLSGLDLEHDELSNLTPSKGEDMSVISSKNWKCLITAWKEYLKGLWSDRDFQTHLKRIFHQTKCVKEFFTSALIPVSDLHHSAQSSLEGSASSLLVPTPKSFVEQSLSCLDPAPVPFSASSTMSSSSSSLPLSLLLAATRLTALHDLGLDTTNPHTLAPLTLSFPVAYAEYVRLLTSAKISASASGAAATPGRVWGRDVAREAWERLVSWGLLVPIGGGHGSTDGRIFRVEVSFEEAVEMVGSGGSLGKWWRDGL